MRMGVRRAETPLMLMMALAVLGVVAGHRLNEATPERR